MGRIRTGLVVAVVLAGAVVALAQTALFPSQLYVYVPPPDLIRRTDFEKVAREVQALEAFLGVNGANLGRGTHCYRQENPLTGELIKGIWWNAPEEGDVTVQRLWCYLSGGTSVAADLQIDDGTPAAVNGTPLACVPGTASSQIMNGDTTLAPNDLVHLQIGAIAGNCLAGANAGVACAVDSECPSSSCSVPSLTFCFVVQ